MLLGFNNWKVKKDPLSMKHSTIVGEDDELWWEVTFDVPKDALCVNFVVNAGNSWDNNGGKDHKVRFVCVQVPPTCWYVLIALLVVSIPAPK